MCIHNSQINASQHSLMLLTLNTETKTNDACVYDFIGGYLAPFCCLVQHTNNSKYSVIETTNYAYLH